MAAIVLCCAVLRCAVLCSCVVVQSASAGCAVYSVRPFGVCASYGPAVSGGWGVVELRYASSLLAVCGSGLLSSRSPRTVVLLDARSLRVLSELSFASGVVDLRLSGERLICCTPDKVHVFDLRSLQQLYAVPGAASTRGACAVVPFEQPPPSSSAAFIALSSAESTGDVSVFNYDGQLLAAVRAHSRSIRMVALSSDGCLLASCSTSGTLIRIFSLPEGVKLLTLRRGTLSSHVNCLVFNPRATRLCVSSADSTSVHVFSIPQQHQQHSPAAAAGPPASSSISHWPVAAFLRQSVLSLSSLTPLSGRVEDLVEPSRAAAVISLKSEHEPLAVAFTEPASHDVADELLHVVTRAGSLFTYAVLSSGDSGEAVQGNGQLECKLQSVHALHSDAVAVQSHSVQPIAAMPVQSYP